MANFLDVNGAIAGLAADVGGNLGELVVH